jgi:hypothetical protein
MLAAEDSGTIFSVALPVGACRVLRFAGKDVDPGQWPLVSTDPALNSSAAEVEATMKLIVDGAAG